jgi:hypothetical protein
MGLVDRVDRLVVPDRACLDHLLDLVVEDEDAAFVVDREHCVADLEVQVLDDDDPERIALVAQLPQRHEFGDRVVFAIAEFAEELPRRRPVVLDPPIDGILDIGRLVHEGIDLFDLLQFVERGDVFDEATPGRVVAFVGIGRFAGRAVGVFLELETVDDFGPFRKRLQILLTDLIGAEQPDRGRCSRRRGGKREQNEGKGRERTHRRRLWSLAGCLLYGSAQSPAIGAIPNSPMAIDRGQ